MLGALLRHLPDRRTIQLLALCAALAFVLDFIYFTGFFGSDDVGYLQAARQIANLGSEIQGFNWRDSIANTRLGIAIPDGLVYWLADGKIVVIAWFHVIYHLALVILAYAVGRELDHARTGLLAAALVACNPILYVYAGAVLPDLATAVWLALLLLLLLRARRRALDGPLAARESLRRYFLAGLVLGVAYACKETALIMSVPCAVVIIAGAPRLRSMVWVRDGAFLLAGLIAFVLLEALLLRVLAGEWISRLGAVQDSGDVFAERMTKQGSGPFERFSHLWSLLRGSIPAVRHAAAPLSTVLLLGLALVFPLLRRRNVTLIAFFWWPLLYMTVGSTNLTEYRPSSIQVRYYAIVILPAAVMTALVLGTLLERWQDWARRPRWAGRRWAAVALVSAMALVAWYEAGRNLDLGGNLYRAADARAFVVAYQQARSDYPEHQIVLSRDFRLRMTPLLYPRAPDNVFAHKTLTPWDKEFVLPLILLSPQRDALPEGISASRDLKLGDVEVRTLEVVYPIRRRSDILLDALRRAVGARPRRHLPRAKRGAAVIQLLTAPSGAQ